MFQVTLSNYRGPLDLLLYLVRKHELETSALSLAAITNQFINYLATLKEIDLTPVGEFVEIASTLLEIKSRVALPHAEEEEEIVDANREDLVTRLLEYKQYRDAASLLEERAHEAQQRFGRIADRHSHADPDLKNQPIHEVELWDLVGAMSRLIRDANTSRGTNIVYDETPIHVFMDRIHERLLNEDGFALSELFAAKMHKSTMISTFLALLELVRHHHVSTDQGDAYGEVWIRRGPGFEAENKPDFSAMDSTTTGPLEAAQNGEKPSEAKNT